MPELERAWLTVVQAEPLCLHSLGLKDPTPAKHRRELKRRRLRHWQVSVHLDMESIEHVTQKGNPPELKGSAKITLTLTRVGRPRMKPISITALGRLAVPATVVTQGETLAMRQAAQQAAATAALKEAIPLLLKAR